MTASPLGCELLKSGDFFFSFLYSQLLEPCLASGKGNQEVSVE